MKLRFECVLDMLYTFQCFFCHKTYYRLGLKPELALLPGTAHRHRGFGRNTHNGIVPWSLCQFPKKIKIDGVGKLSSVVPSYAFGQMQKLKKLIVKDCELLIEVFETQGIKNINNDDGGGCSSLTGPIPDVVRVPQLSNLKKLYILNCNLLQHVFTFSTLESLRQLQELRIRYCDTMKVIVMEENDNQRKVVEFPRLKSLELDSLPNLEGFFLGLNEFEWPSLEKVTIGKCPQIRVFTAGESRAKELKYIHTSLGKHTLECGLNFDLTTVLPHQKKLLPSSETTNLCLKRLPWWSYHNVIEIDMGWNYNIRSIIPSNELMQVQKLERIRVTSCDDVEEVFEVVPTEGTNSETQTVVEIPNLKHVEMEFMDRLEYMWKTNYHVELEFPNLTILSIAHCDRLKHVFTSVMVGSLAQLQELHILSCSRMKSVIDDIDDEEEKSKCNLGIEQTVVLRCLKVLKLQYLSNLKGFWFRKADFSLPSLDTLKIIHCPQIMLFTTGKLDTPALDIIDTSFERCYVEEDDINSFIKTRQQEGFEF